MKDERLSLMFKLLFVFFLSIVLLSAGHGQTSNLENVKSWSYQLQNISIEQLTEAEYDLFVIDYSADGTESTRFTSAQVESVQRSSRKVLAYMSIGEAEDYRFYWREEWDANHDGRPDLNAPAWLTRGNTDWIGNYKIRYWDPAWQKIIFGTDSSYIDKIIADGYDGVYLDIVDAYYYFGSEKPELPLSDAARRMIDFVKTIANYARAIKCKTEFIIIPQNASGIIEDVEDNAAALEYLNVIDGIGAEDVFFRGNAAQDNPYNPDYYVIEQLDKFKANGKKVLCIDYVSQLAKVEAFYRMCSKKRYIPYATARELDSLIPNSSVDTTYRYQTFEQIDLMQKAVRIPRRGIKPLPNAGNVRDLSFREIYYPLGLVLGIARPDSPKSYGWIRIKQSTNASKFLPHSSSARGFDSIGSRLFVKELRNPRVSRYENHLVGEVLALKINIAASDADITPPGLGDLIYDDGEPSNPFNKKSIREIVCHVDSSLTYRKTVPLIKYIQLDTILTRINRAFSGTITDADTVSVLPFRLSGKKSLGEVTYLKENLSNGFVFFSQFAHKIETGVSDFNLLQNYPNPFNPSTTILFNLSIGSKVTLKIYNLLGQEICILLNNELREEGIHEIEFDALNLPAGIYFYTIETEQCSITKKMILIQ